MSSDELAGLQHCLRQAADATLERLRQTEPHPPGCSQLTVVCRILGEQAQRFILCDALNRHQFNLTHTAEALWVRSPADLLRMLERVGLLERARRCRQEYRAQHTADGSIVAQRLRAWLAKRPMTPSELSRRCGFHKARVGVLFAHIDRTPGARVKIDLVQAMAKGMGVSPEWLQGKSEDGGTESCEQLTTSMEAGCTHDRTT